MRTSKSLLLGSVSFSAAVVAALGASPALAQCATSDSTVTCTGTTNDVQAQAAINAATPPNVTIRVTEGARIATSRGVIAVGTTGLPPVLVGPQPAFSGAIVLDNRGTIGTSPFANIRFLAGGEPGSTASTFTGTNSGVINGEVTVGNFGGGSSFVNNGTVTSSVRLRGPTNQSYAGSGTIQNGPFLFGGTGLFIESSNRVNGIDAGGRFTSTTSGGTATATIDGVLLSPGTAFFQSQFVGASVLGIAGATVTLNGTAGGIAVSAVDANTTSFNQNNFSGGSFSFASSNSSQAVGAGAVLTINTGAVANGTASVSGLTSATATVNGTINRLQSFSFENSLNVLAIANDTTSSQSQSNTAFSRAETSVSRGGTARATIGEGAVLANAVYVAGNSAADATVNGAVGSLTNFSGMTVLAAWADTSSSSSGGGGASDGSYRETTRAGGATATIGVMGTVAGSVFVRGGTDASVLVNGAVGSPTNNSIVSVQASAFDTVQTSSYRSTSDPVLGFSASTQTSSNSRTVLGGAASAIVGTTGRVSGGVSVTGDAAATATINGAVGRAGVLQGNVSATSISSDNVSSSTQRYDGSPVSTFTFTSENKTTARGGAATVTIGATGTVSGTVAANSNRGAATVVVGGSVGSTANQQFGAVGVSATSRGTDTTSASNSGVASSTSTAVGGVAAVTIGDTGRVIGDASASGDASATVANAGTLSGSLSAAAGGTMSSFSRDDTSTTTTTGGITTTTTRSAVVNANTPGAANASVTNNGSAGSVGATGTGNVAFDNTGTVTRGVTLGATAMASSSRQNSETITIVVPAAGGGATTTRTTTNASAGASQSTGGNVSAAYGGTIGTRPADPRMAMQTVVAQTANGASDATISGMMFANFQSTTGGTTTSTSSSSVAQVVTQPVTGAGTPAARSTLTETNRNSTTVTGGASTLLVTGQVRDNGAGTGAVFVAANTGTASATVNGAQIDGALTVVAGQGTSTSSDLDRTTTSTRVASTGFSPFVVQSSNETTSNVSRVAGGTATAALSNARVGGTVFVTGVGTGAGSTGGTATVDATSTVGDLFVQSGSTDSRTDRTNVLANGVRTVTTTAATTISALTGDGRAAVAGRAALINANSTGGNATVDLTGTSTGPVTVFGGGFDRVTTTTTSSAFAPAGNGFVTEQTTGQTRTETGTARGGVATLAVNSSAANAIGGSVLVAGARGATMTVASGSRVLANNGGIVEIVSNFANSAVAETSTFDAGVLTNRTTVTNTAMVAASANLTNAGTIGASTDYFAAPVLVTVRATGGASGVNSGSIFGDLAVSGLNANRTTTNAFTPAVGPGPQRTVTTTAFAAIGGPASVTNSGLVSGQVSVAGASGVLTNSGVIRGVARLGASASNFTSTTTAVTTFGPNGPVFSTSTTPATPATVPFAQNYTLNQNGLLLGGVNIAGATTPDPTTGAPVRTSTVAATVNLNAGSITLGDVTAQTGPSGRLTNTAVNLTGDGFLGAAPGLQSRQPGGALVAYANTPNFGAFVRIDPALGTTGAGDFLPSPTLASGSRITGVDTVAKTGAGAFTLVGAPLVGGSGSPAYTVDAGTLRVSGGELQLGLAGGDPSTGRSVFGIRGAVQNDASLVLGRRITDGTRTGVEGIAVSVLGNLTQSMTGTLVLGSAPTPAALTGAAALASTPSFLTVDGNLTLAGTVALPALSTGIFLSGRGPDVASVSGSFTNNATVASPFASPFIAFALTPRSEGGRTVVSIDVTRRAFATVATNVNAASAAGALQAAIPAAIAAPNGELAQLITTLDTRLTGALAAAVFDDLGQSSFYGSLSAIATTRPFGEVDDGGANATSDESVGLWFRTSGGSSRWRGDVAAGSRDLSANRYGFAFGLKSQVAGFVFGIGGGHGWTDAQAGLGRARAETFLLGGFASGRAGPLILGAQAVYGWSSWNASRAVPTLGPFATTTFDGREFRVNGRAAVELGSPELNLAPFASVEVRSWRFDPIVERNGGIGGVAIGGFRRTTVTPEVGARLTGRVGVVSPFIEASYAFQPDIGSKRTAVLLGTPGTGFFTQGVMPNDFAKIGGGINTHLGRARLFVRGDVAVGGGNRDGAVRGGVALKF